MRGLRGGVEALGSSGEGPCARSDQLAPSQEAVEASLLQLSADAGTGLQAAGGAGGCCFVSSAAAGKATSGFGGARRGTGPCPSERATSISKVSVSTPSHVSGSESS